MVYEIAGPLFFGSAEKAIEGVKIARKGIRSVIFNLENVPTMDLTGLVAFESAILNLLSRSVSIHISGVREQPMQLLKKSEVLKANPQIHFEKKLSSALAYAKEQYFQSQLHITNV